MAKKYLLMIALTMTSIVLASPEAHGFAANNETECSAAGGTFTTAEVQVQAGQSQNTTTSTKNICTVAGSTTTEITKDVGQPGGKAFTLTTTSATVEYTKLRGVTTTTVIVPASTVCRNPGGDEMSLTNRNCLL